MVTYRIDQKSLNDFVKQLRSLGHIIADPNMQLYRAKKYRDYTIEMIREGRMNIRPLSELTQVISGEPHNPLWLKGAILESMGVKPVGKNAAEAGYWDADSGILQNTAKKPITVAHWVRALHTGFRIPLKGEKGNRVRGWFKFKHGIEFPWEQEWINVPPRPFMMLSYWSYLLNGKDIEAVTEYIDKLANSPIDQTRSRKTANI